MVEQGRFPQPGDEIYIDSHPSPFTGEDSGPLALKGGKVTVKELLPVEGNEDIVYILDEEIGQLSLWTDCLDGMQEELREIFGDQRARAIDIPTRRDIIEEPVQEDLGQDSHTMSFSEEAPNDEEKWFDGIGEESDWSDPRLI